MTTYTFNSDTEKAVSGIKEHFEKALVLKNLAVKLTPNLEIDEAELKEHGFTSASNSYECSAVIEGIFLELYSSIDCARKVIVTIYKKCRGIPDSTRKLFAKVVAGKVGGFPAELQAAFTAATWYDELMMIRDELTHSSIGRCSRAPNGETTYMHFGVTTNSRPLVYEDVFSKLEELMNGINQFLGHVFRHINQGLTPAPVDAVCGFFNGRCYTRKLVISERIDFHSGACMSRQWFDNDAGFRCPLAESCGAYSRELSQL